MFILCNPLLQHCFDVNNQLILMHYGNLYTLTGESWRILAFFAEFEFLIVLSPHKTLASYKISKRISKNSFICEVFYCEPSLHFSTRKSLFKTFSKYF